MKEGFGPIVDSNARHLILGTLPGDESLRKEQYYADPCNQLWAILGKVYGESIGADYAARVEFLHRKGIAVWDVLRAAERDGSLDSAISAEVPNEFGPFLREFPELRTIGFNGGKASSIFRRLVSTQAGVTMADLAIVVLPSTSPTAGRNVLSLDEKVSRWHDFLLCPTPRTSATAGHVGVQEEDPPDEENEVRPTVESPRKVIERTRTLRPSSRASPDSSYKVAFPRMAAEDLLRLTVFDEAAPGVTVGLYEFRGSDLAGLASIHFKATWSARRWHLRFTPVQPRRVAG